MKNFKKLFLGLLVFLILNSGTMIGQENANKEEFKPVFITVTKAHRSQDPNVDFSDWLKTEKEYFNEVTNKNDLILSSGVYFHYFTPDDSEVYFVSVYKNWENVEKSGEVSNELAKKAWPDEEKRNAFFKKKGAYYSPVHSDEIYKSLPFTKDLETKSTKPLIYYVKVNQLGDGGKGFKEYFENVTMKNQYIKGYYTHRHYWGANSRDAVEVFVVENLSDIEKLFEEDTKLVNEHWPDKDKREAFFKDYRKIFSGHGDYILTNVPELSK